MPLTVFYSWQTDAPARVNRNFIEDALKRALKQINVADADIVNADRGEEVKLDKDTAGRPGTPPIVDTIFSKIDQCAVFVPDLTFVARTEAGRPTPNANVLIEYGWALKSRGYGRIVPVMNDAFGEPSETSLPFNMRHLRWPTRYALPHDADTAARAGARRQLVSELARNLRAVLSNAPVEQVSTSTIEETPTTYDQAVFFDLKEPLGIRPGRVSETDEKCYVLEGPKVFLRLIPTVPAPEITATQARTKLEEGRMQPFAVPRIGGGEWYDRNRYGAIVFRTAGDTPAIEQLTQLFKNNEIWGISVDLQRIKEHLGFGVVLCGFEDAFVRGFQNYRTFAEEQLQLALPIRVVGGIVGIEGFKISAPPDRRFGGWSQYGGRSVEPNVLFEATLEDWAALPETVLMPFFERVWEAFGLDRSQVVK